MTNEEELKLVEKTATDLAEHFDSVQIFASRHEPALESGTVTLNVGLGNFYARYGQVREWITMQDERERMKARKEEVE